MLALFVHSSSGTQRLEREPFSTRDRLSENSDPVVIGVHYVSGLVYNLTRELFLVTRKVS